MIDYNVPQALRYLRKHKMVSQTTVYRRTGVSIASVSAYETGRVQPSIKALEILAHYYKLSMSQFFAFAEMMASDEAPT